MANYFDTGILLTAGFSLSSSAPLDGRSVVELLTDLDTHIAENRAYEGMCVYVKENKKIYIYNGTTWEEFVGGGSPEKQIKDWVSGSNYLEGDYIYHEGEMYRCLASNNDVDFDETNWKQLTYGIDELSKEDVEGLLGLTEEEIEAMADLILDTEVRIDKTYSSSKIHADIQQCLQDSKDFTLGELGSKIGASYEVVTSTDDMVSQDYLYLLNNGNGYDIYIVDVDNIPVVIGDTTIDLSNYYDRTEIDTKFEEELGVEVLNTTAQTVKGAINELLVSGGGEVMDTTELTSSALGGIGAGADLDGMTAIEILTQMLYPYVKPTVSATGTPNGGTFEVGNTQTITNVRAVVGKKSKEITSVEVLDGASSLSLLNDDTVKNGGTFDFSVNVAVASVNKQLTVVVTDADGTQVTAKTGAFTFVYPYYVGICDENATINEALIKGLTKKVETKATKTISYTTSNQKMVFAYPSSYGAISKIYDSNNFDVTNTFTRQEVSVTGLDGQAVNYYVYTNEASTVSGFSMKFQY